MTGREHIRPPTKETFKCIQNASAGARNTREGFFILVGMNEIKGYPALKFISDLRGRVSRSNTFSE
jgi:hypothetical protein